MAKAKTTTKRKKPTARDTKATQQAKKQMWAVVLFAIGILMLALTLIPGDKLWHFVHNILFGLFGWSTYFIAPLVIYIAVIAAMDKPLSSIKAKLWQVCILVVMISSSVQLFSGLPELAGLPQNLGALYAEGIERTGGGVFAALFSMPLRAILGDTGAKIIIILAIFVFTMLITGSTLLSLYRWLAVPVKEIGDSYTAHVEEIKNRPQTEKTHKIKKDNNMPFNIDVDISRDSDNIEWEKLPEEDITEPPDMPTHPVMTKPAEPTTIQPEPVVEEAITTNNDLNVDSPIEYIEASARQGFKSQPKRPHPLEDEIRQIDSQSDIEQIVDRFLQENPIAPPELSDHFIAGDISPAHDEPIPDEDVSKEILSDIDSEATTDSFVIPEYEYRYPPIDLLSQTQSITDEALIREELQTNSQLLEDTLKSFGVQTRVVDICRGPAVTRYEIQPSAGVKISRITGLADDIALALAAAGIRIEAPIPNKSAVGIEVPNKNVSIVGLREIIDSKAFSDSSSSITVALGKDITGDIITADIGKMPHMLVAGSTGSGKSVCINSLIMSILYKSPPDEVKFVMIDPKMVELGIYNGIPHLLIPVVTDPKKAAGALSWAVSEMLDRYERFKVNHVRDIAGYNRLAATRDDLDFMPKIVIIIDELADLMMTAPKEVEDAIMRLAQMARAAGMHLIIATQRPAVSVITGDIKANIPSRIAFAVSSQFDSRTILDMGGAERLLGRGDMLFYPVGSAKPMRVQGCFVSDTEVEKVVGFIKESANVTYDQQVVEQIDKHVIAEKGKKLSVDDGGGFDDEDNMMPAAIECVVEAGQASTSQLQRRLKLGYARAARIIDQLEERGIVGPFEGSKPRQVLITKDMWIEMKLNGLMAPATGSVTEEEA